MRIHYSIWKQIRRCAILVTLLINIPYIAEMEAFANEEERWEQAWNK